MLNTVIAEDKEVGTKYVAAEVRRIKNDLKEVQREPPSKSPLVKHGSVDHQHVCSPSFKFFYMLSIHPLSYLIFTFIAVHYNIIQHTEIPAIYFLPVCSYMSLVSTSSAIAKIFIPFVSLILCLNIYNYHITIGL